MASDPNASYLPTGYYKFQHQPNGWHFAVKTGTTNDGFDGLMTSWSTKYAVVTWVGNHTRNQNLNTFMEYLTTPLAKGWMEAAHKNLKPVNWTAPAGVKTLPAFVVRKHIHNGDIEPSPTNDLFPSWYQAKAAGSATNQTIDKVSKKVATSCTPAAAKDNQTNGNANSFSVDIFVSGSGAANSGASATAAGTDDVHNCNDVKPSITVTATGCDIVATASQGTHPLSSADFPGNITFLVSGQPVGSTNVSDSPSTASYHATPGTTSVTVKVTDSVLYDASSTVDVSCAGAPTASALGGISRSGSAISWTGGTGTVTIYKSNNSTFCGPVSASAQTCSGTGNPGSGYYGIDSSDPTTHVPGS
jgi:membrane carboxypeptidase/penicillin-binding protein PbpC